MTIQKQTSASVTRNLSQEFGTFLNNYVETERLCFYLPEKNQDEPEPIKILANTALVNQNFYLPVFLKKFDLENNIENLTKLTDSFINFVEACKLRLQHFDRFNGIPREVWNDTKFDGVYVKEDNITFLNFDKIY